MTVRYSRLSKKSPGSGTPGAKDSNEAAGILAGRSLAYLKHPRGEPRSLRPLNRTPVRHTLRLRTDAVAAIAETRTSAIGAWHQQRGVGKPADNLAGFIDQDLAEAKTDFTDHAVVLCQGIMDAARAGRRDRCRR